MTRRAKAPRQGADINSPAHWLSVFSAVMHLAMGFAGFYPGPWPYPPSWLALYELVPGTDVAYPAAYILTGLVAGVGIWQTSALRLSLYMSAVLFLIWGLLGFQSMALRTGGNIQGASANLFVAGLLIVVAYYVGKGTQVDRINQTVAHLQEQADEVRGQ